MEDKQQASTTKSSAKPNDKQTKIAVVIFPPQGGASIKYFTRETPLPEGFVLKDSVAVGSKSFDKVPKRLEIFLEKGGFGNEAPKDEPQKEE